MTGPCPLLTVSHNSFRRAFSPRPKRRKSSVAIKWTEEDFQTAFQLFDRDEDGTITREEVETVLESLGQQPTTEELDQLLNEVSGE